MKDEAMIRPAAGSHLEQAATIASTFNLPNPKSQPSLKVIKNDGPRSNVIADDVHRDALAAGLTSVARIVGRTLGPHGSNALIRDDAGAHFATKDGYTVLQRLTFVQETANMVLDHVRSVSRAMVRKVGDGSTSAVIMADSLYTSLGGDVLRQFPPGAVQSALAVVSDVLTDRIRAVARPIASENDIITVATVAANNDPWAGSQVAEAYRLGGDNANVFVAIGGERTEIRKEPGYRVLRGMAHDCFANEVGIDGSSNTTCRMRDSQIMIYDGVVDQTAFNLLIAPTMNGCIEKGQPFVLVAREYTPDIIQIVVEFKRKSPGVKLLLLDHAASTRRGAARLGDLASVLGCGVVTADHTAESQPKCGFAVEVRSTGSETVFIVQEVTDAAKARAADLTAQADRVDSSNHGEEMTEELDELRARIRALLGSEVTIFVGGSTEQEKRTLQYLLDDAALAVRAALRSGIVEGLGFTAQRILIDADCSLHAEVIAGLAERCRLPSGKTGELGGIVLDAVRDAYAIATKRVLENARLPADDIWSMCMENCKGYNALTGEFSNPDVTVVVNPADTDVEVLRGATSIVGLFITSDQTLLTRPASGGGLD
jgi:chaperonin GroEL